LSTSIWNPVADGLSVSGLNLWLIDKVAYDLQYLQGFEVVELWDKKRNYGNLVQAGIEGWIKTREQRGISKFIEAEYVKQVQQYAEHDQITWWTRLAEHQVNIWRDLYDKDIDRYSITSSEEKYVQTILLPSGRVITLKGYMDGSGDKAIMENKCRGAYSPEAIAGEIKWDLQYNYYLMLYYSYHGRLPEVVWYQHIKRPGGFGYRGPRQKKAEDSHTYLERLKTHITDNKEDHYYQFIGRPTMPEFRQFCYACLYPMLEAFIDWYTGRLAVMMYKANPQGDPPVNKTHWITPYGLYNPFTEGVQEKFREYRLTGSTIGLRRKHAPTTT